MLEISLILSIILNIILIYISINLYKKYTLIENVLEGFSEVEKTFNDVITQITERYIEVLNQLKRVDSRGSFESDDEVGFVFKTIKNTISQLVKYNEYVKRTITGERIEEDEK